MSTSDKLKMLFEAAMLEPESATASRMVPMPRNPDGSMSQSSESENTHAEHFDPRQEMLARVNHMKEILTNG